MVSPSEGPVMLTETSDVAGFFFAMQAATTTAAPINRIDR